MKNINVACAVIIKDNKVFVCRRGPGRVLEGAWEFPGGKEEQNEDLKETVKREIKEELNSTIEAEYLIGTTSYDYVNMAPYEDFHIDLTAYLCVLKEGELTLSEHTASLWADDKKLDSIEFAPADAPLVKNLHEMLKVKLYTIKQGNNGDYETIWSKKCTWVEQYRKLCELTISCKDKYQVLFVYDDYGNLINFKKL